jgi:hypothetical protein
MVVPMVLLLLLTPDSASRAMRKKVRVKLVGCEPLVGAGQP